MVMVLGGSGTIAGLSANGLPAGSVTSSALSSDAVYLTAPAGAICFVCQSSAPTGWIKANGAAISRTTYSALFAAIGTTFGVGDGSTTFNVPDLRGYFPRGWDDSAGVDSGRSFGSAQADAHASHSHSFSYQQFNNQWSGSTVTGMADTGGNAATKNTTNTGGTETRPKNVALLACIKF